MGADYYAKAAIGLKISPKQLQLPPIKVKTFEHNYSEEFQFDPKNGKPLWKMEQQLHKSCDEEREFFGSYPMIHSTDSKDFVIAVVKTDSDTYRECNMAKLPSQRAITKFKNDMMAAGLWNEADFGLWAVQYCSY